MARVHGIVIDLSHPKPIGALAAALIAGWIGVRGGIALGWAVMAISILLLVRSPLPRVRQASDVPTET